MSQLEILKAIAQQPGILQPDIWKKHPEITRDSTQLKAIRRKNLATREQVQKGRTFKWRITEDGLKTINNRYNVV